MLLIDFGSSSPVCHKNGLIYLKSSLENLKTIMDMTVKVCQPDITYDTQYTPLFQKVEIPIPRALPDPTRPDPT